MTTPLTVVDQFATAVGTGDFDTALALVAPDAIDHSPLPGAPEGHAGWLLKWRSLGALAGTVEIGVEQRVASGDTVATRYAIRGAGGGEPLGFALDMLRVRDGKIIEHWGLPLPEGGVEGS